MRTLSVTLLLSLFTFGGTAWAEGEPQDRKAIENAKEDGILPPAKSDNDPIPPAPSPNPLRSGLVEQAGIGGVVSYGRAGVLELGGSASFAAADGYLRFAISPSIGYFIIDNIELSAIIGLSHVRIDVEDSTGTTDTATQTLLSVLVEPSVHLPFTDSLFGFFGLGLGLSYAEESGAGFLLEPRLGMNVLVGRSGILSPAIYVQYATTSAIQTDQGTLLQVNFGYGLNVGYTVMW